MKVVQINETCGTGSIGRSCAELAQYLEDQGHESYVFYAMGNPTYHNSFRVVTDFEQKLHAALSRITGLQGYFSKRDTKKLIKKLDDIKPDVVHLQNLHSNYINIHLLFGYLAKNDIATVNTLHDCWLFTGKCTYYVPTSCEKWKQECGNCPLLHKDNINPTFFFDTTKKCLADKKKWLTAIPRLATVGVSQWVTNEAKESILKDTNPIAIYNWIDSNVFHPKDTGKIVEKHKLNDKFVVLMVTTNIVVKKGYNVLIALSKCLPQEYQLIVVGMNVERVPIPENVIQIPHTNDANELADYYSTADVCVNTTQFETFGKVTAEALCCGTPVVVYNNTASPELVGDGCGYVVDNNDIDGVVASIEKIKANGKEMYSDKCVAYAKKRFDQETNIRKFVELYDELIARKHSRREEVNHDKQNN